MRRRHTWALYRYLDSVGVVRTNVHTINIRPAAPAAPGGPGACICILAGRGLEGGDEATCA